MRVVDLRSDTVTVPTPEMRRAMADAEVGDDVYGEDPTVCRLEELAAELTGKEAALFCTSGTMGNQVAAMTHTRRGDEVIVEKDSHIYFYEVAGLAVISSVQPCPVPSDRGVMDPAVVQAHIRTANVHYPRTGLICVEQTHNRAGGTVTPLDNLAAIVQVAHAAGVPVHMDGARVFNAAIRLGVPVSRVVAGMDSVQFCLSKGLCAPVGSMVVGSKGFIAEARRARKMMGGGMRQAGVLAAAGVIALTRMVERLPEDHANARLLAEGMADLPHLSVDLTTVQTNICTVTAGGGWDAPALVAALKAGGVRANNQGSSRVRFVCHKDVSTDDVRYALGVINRVVRAGATAAAGLMA